LVAGPWGNRRAAIVQAIIVLLLTLLDVRIVLNLITGQRYLGIAVEAPLWVFMLTLGIAVFVFGVYTNIDTERRLRAATAGDKHTAPLANAQPDPTIALQPGETLTLTRRMRRNSLWLQWTLLFPVALLGSTMFACIGDLYVYLAFPHTLQWLAAYWTGSHTSLLPVNLPSLSPLEWAAILLPFILALVMIIIMVVG
jgi:hypothetical protein